MGTISMVETYTCDLLDLVYNNTLKHRKIEFVLFSLFCLLLFCVYISIMCIFLISFFFVYPSSLFSSFNHTLLCHRQSGGYFLLCVLQRCGDKYIMLVTFYFSEHAVILKGKFFVAVFVNVTGKESI